MLFGDLIYIYISSLNKTCSHIQSSGNQTTPDEIAYIYINIKKHLHQIVHKDFSHIKCCMLSLV